MNAELPAKLPVKNAVLPVEVDVRMTMQIMPPAARIVAMEAAKALIQVRRLIQVRVPIPVRALVQAIPLVVLTAATKATREDQ